MASPEAEAAKAQMRAFAEAAVGSGVIPTLEQQRASMVFIAESATEPAGVTISETYAGGSRAYWHDPVNGSADRVVLYVHGGG